MSDELLEIPEEVEIAFLNALKVYNKCCGFRDVGEMDGDDTEKMSKIFLIYSDLEVGNITADEFWEEMDQEGWPGFSIPSENPRIIKIMEDY